MVAWLDGPEAMGTGHGDLQERVQVHSGEQYRLLLQGQLDERARRELRRAEVIGSIKDRMDLAGARWTVPGAGAVLRLRAVITNGDFEQYWTYHQQQELRRNHLDHYQQLDLAA